MLRIEELVVSPLDVPLLEPFTIATGAQHVAHNVLVEMRVRDSAEGTIVGYGEAAPVAHISGETQADVLDTLPTIASTIKDLDLLHYRAVCGVFTEALGHLPSALCAVETALFDILAKRSKVSLLDWFGASEQKLRTDITITTGTLEQSVGAARRYHLSGFDRFKIKVGGSDLDTEIKRVLSIATTAPQAELILDGNTAFSSEQAIELIAGLSRIKDRILCFEQPVVRDDFEGLGRVERETQICVVADESLRSEEDFRRILRQGDVSGINIKTAKLGILGAFDLLVAARRAGLKVMVGGMVETELSMTGSACLAAGVGGVDFIDLDTPLLLGPRPLTGGFVQEGPILDLGPISLGHGVTPLTE